VSQSILELFWTITIVIVQNNSKMDCDNFNRDIHGTTQPQTLRPAVGALRCRRCQAPALLFDHPTFFSHAEYALPFALPPGASLSPEALLVGFSFIRTAEPPACTASLPSSPNTPRMPYLRASLLSDVALDDVLFWRVVPSVRRVEFISPNLPRGQRSLFRGSRAPPP